MILLSIVLTTSLYAFLGWRSFIDQEHYLKSLHPFISSQHLYDQLILQNPSTYDLQIRDAFHALCDDILGVKQGYLIPMGIFGPLVGGTISYPNEIEARKQNKLQEEIRRLLATNPGIIPILLAESKGYGQNALAIPLRSERGLIGVLVLGDKLNSSLFTQEEVEIARTVGERLIDSKASNELAQRLMEQERQHVAETRVVDQQTRRVLHDDILPRLQSLMIKLSSNPDGNSSTIEEMGEIHHQLAGLMHELPSLVEPEIARQGLVEALKAGIENDYRPYFNTIDWQVDGLVIENVKPFTPYVSNVLYHATREAVRNAATHGRYGSSDQPLHLKIGLTWLEGLTIEVEDDGMGFNPSTMDGPKDGHGLSIHSTMMAVVGGSLSVDSIPGKYTRVTLYIPA